MYDLNFLQTGKIFPPLEEAKRVGACAEHDLMFDGNTYAVEQRVFKETLRNLNKLATLLGWTDSYIAVEYNYFKLCSKKTADFVCGEFPDIRATNKNAALREREQAVLDLIREKAIFDTKHYDAWLDVSKYGEEYLRVYQRKDKRGTFTLQSPAMLFRITSEEDDYETLYYVVAWITNDGKELHTQIHEKGKYTIRNFSIAPAIVADLTGQVRYESANVQNGKSDLFSLLHDRYTDEIFRYNGFRIGEQIGTDEVVETGLDDFAIIRLSGIQNAERSHGVSDYEDFASVVSQMQRTMTQVQLIFDKYTTPTAYGAVDILSQLGNGESALEIGKFWGIPEGGVVPGFLEPDLSKLQYYFEQLRFNIDRIKELSEMGAAFTADTTVGNIAVETMKATYSSALKKAERLTTKNTDAIKKLFYLISQLGYETVVPVEDISITWYDGLPNDEQKDIDAARSKVEGGFSCRKQEFVNRFNHTENEFDDMWTQYLSEENDLNTVRAAGMFNPFSPQNGGADGGEKADGQEGESEAIEPQGKNAAPEDGDNNRNDG